MNTNNTTIKISVAPEGATVVNKMAAAEKAHADVVVTACRRKLLCCLRTEGEILVTGPSGQPAALLLRAGRTLVLSLNRPRIPVLRHVLVACRMEIVRFDTAEETTRYLFVRHFRGGAAAADAQVRLREYFGGGAGPVRPAAVVPSKSGGKGETAT